MFIVGELINGMYKKVGAAIQEKNKKTIQDLAVAQTNAGASALDVNCGPASAKPAEDIKWLVETIQEVVNTPLALDSTKSDVIEAGLSIAKSQTVINSTSADQEKLDILVPMALKYNSSLIGLAMNKKGVPQDKFQRLELADGRRDLRPMVAAAVDLLRHRARRDAWDDSPCPLLRR